MKIEGMGNLFGYKEWGITTGKERLGEVGHVSVEVIRMSADLLALYRQRKGDGALGI